MFVTAGQLILHSHRLKEDSTWTFHLLLGIPVPTRGGGNPYKLPGPGGPEGASKTDFVAHVFCLSQYNYYMLIVQIIPFRTSPSHSTTDSLSDVVSRLLTGQPLIDGPEKIFHWDPKPLSVALQNPLWSLPFRSYKFLISVTHINATSFPISLLSSAYKCLVNAKQYLWASYRLAVQ